MFAKITDWIANVLVEFLFGMLFKVLYVYNLPTPIRYSFAAIVIILYGLIEYALIHYALVYYHSGNTYMAILCIVGFVVFLTLIIAGFLHQRNNM